MNDYSKKLTITLTLKGRDEFTYRWMDYMNNIACPYKILIADGGDNKFLEEHLQNYSNYPLIHYEYIRYPFDETTSLFFKKLESLISKVTTEYILQADNDDFFLLDRIPELIDFLEN
jgi:glycosyltransferase domain-containing protein